jgi:hypothetical protein
MAASLALAMCVNSAMAADLPGPPAATAAASADAGAPAVAVQTPECQAALADMNARWQAATARLKAADWKTGTPGLQQAEAAAQAATTQCTGSAADEATLRLGEIRAQLQAADLREQKLKTCQPLSDQAMSADIQAATAQSQKKALQEIASLYDQAQKLWASAADACEGKDRERAQANLADTSKARAAVALVQGAGVQCEASNRDAAAMQELAKQASTERRWADAAIYFRKTANMWEVASERCSGPQAQLAQTRREQSATDAHNAEFCAPLFEQARDTTQELKVAPGSISSPGRQELSRNAEVKWLTAAARCRGSAAEVAQANAQRLAKERGTPLPAGMVPLSDQRTPQQMASASERAPGNANGSAVGRPLSAAATSVASPASSAASRTAPASQDLQVVVPGQATERMAGTTRLIGVFKSGPDGAMLNGFGKVIWENGGVYEGAMVNGARTGRGKYVWPNGQSYDGDWRNDTPMGSGLLRFANGDRYEGTLVDGAPDGSGTMQFAQGDVYTGEFKAGRQHGNGSFVWKNGNRYAGQWVGGVRQGSGVYTWNNGDAWIGEFSADQQTANGKLVRKTEAEAEAKTDGASKS